MIVQFLQSKVYAAMAYHDQPLQYINRYYFHIKTEGDKHYDTIYNIMNMLVALPISIFIAFILVAIRYTPPIIAALLKRLSKHQLNEVTKELSNLKTNNVCVQTLEENDQKKVYFVKVLKSDHAKRLSGIRETNTAYVEQILKETNSKHSFYIISLPANNRWKIYEELVLFLSILLNVALLVFHIASAVELINYSNEVLQSHEDSDKDHSGFIHTSIAFSFIIPIITYIIAIVMYIIKYHKKGCDIISLGATSITVNIIHLVCCFMPYMLLAFIYDPLQTTITYLALGIYILCGYLFGWIIRETLIFYMDTITYQINDEHGDETDDVTDSTYNLCTFKSTKVSKFIFYITVFCFGQGLFTAVAFSSFVIVYVLTLGSFNDFEVIQNLLPPLLIGMLTYFVVKPTSRQAKKKFNLDDDDHIAKLLKEEIVKEHMQCKIEINDDPSNKPKTT